MILRKFNNELIMAIDLKSYCTVEIYNHGISIIYIRLSFTQLLIYVAFLTEINAKWKTMETKIWIRNKKKAISNIWLESTANGGIFWRSKPCSCTHYTKPLNKIYAVTNWHLSLLFPSYIYEQEQRLFVYLFKKGFILK